MEKKWWQNEVIYQIYPKSFKDSNNDGIGDINGITEKLDYLKELGVTSLWLSPFLESPMIDNGYDISNYYEINPEFGTIEDFNKLMLESKKRNIKIIIDLVINHTSDQHSWFQEALKNPKSKYRDYYIFKKGINNQPPNNWRSLFGGSVWEKLPNENMYYFHVFHKKQPDLNWENKNMRNDLYKMINWWLNKGVAGFRIDAITFIKKDLDFKSLPPDGIKDDGLVSCKHKSLNRPGIEMFLKELKENTFKKYNAVTVGEAPGVPYTEYNDFIGDDGYFSMIFDFKYSDLQLEKGNWFGFKKFNYFDFINILEKSQIETQKTGWGAVFFENHDQPRSISKLIQNKSFQNLKSAKFIALLNLFLRGTPFIYQGQEIGMQNFERTSIEQFDDLESIDNFEKGKSLNYSEQISLYYINKRSRDNARTPFYWSNEQYAGFSDSKPWIQMTQEYPTINANTSNELLQFYKKCIYLRQSSEYSEVLTFGNIEFIEKNHSELIHFKRHYQNKEVKILINFSEHELSINEIKHSKILLSTHNKAQNIAFLKPFEGVVYLN